MLALRVAAGGLLFLSLSHGGFALLQPEPPESIPRIDVHAHYRHPRTFLQPLLESWNMRAVLVDVALPDVAARQQRWEAIRAHRAALPDLFELGSSLEPSRIDDPEFARSTIARLETEIEQGAVLVKVWKDTGMVVRDAGGRWVQVDDSRLQPIWDYLAEAGIPVLAHIGEPLQAWRPLEEDNPHYDYYSRNPQYHAYQHPEIPRWETIMAARDRWLARNPRLTVIGAHLGSMAHDVDLVAERLEAYPNFSVETAARFGDLTRQESGKVRRFFHRYQDRVLYGTDLSTRRPEAELSPAELAAERERMEKTFRLDWQYLSGRGPMRFERGTFAVDTECLELPPEVLRKFYAGNAARLLGL